MKLPWFQFLTRTLHGRLILITSTPLIVLTLLLTANSVRDRQRENLAMLHDAGNSAASYLATIADFALYSGNRLLLSSLAASTTKIANVTGVAFLDNQRRVVVATPDFPAPPALLAAPLRARPVEDGHHLYFEQRVILSGVEVNDYPEAVDPEPDNLAQPTDNLGWVMVAIDLTASIRERQAILRNSVAIAGAVMLAAFLLTYIRIRRIIVAPITQLTRTVGRMERGDLLVRATPGINQELSALATSINHLAESVTRSQQNLEDRVRLATDRLQHTLKNLQTKNQELVLASRTAEAANQAKGEFLARMSHELRTPLTAIKGFVRLLETSDLEPAEKSYCLIIDQATVHLLSLIDDILEFTRLQSRVVALETAPFDLAECLEHPIRLLAPLAHAKGLELILDIDPEIPLALVGDSSRLRQIIANLVGNAIKFTSRGYVRVAVLRLSADAGSTTLKILVEDTGIGMSATQQRQVFTAFVQADTSISRRFGGTGLGLAIVKSLVELMQGTIAASGAPGAGTTLTTTLRLARQTGVEEVAATGALALYDLDALSRQALAHALGRCCQRLTAYHSLDDLIYKGVPADVKAIVVSAGVKASSAQRLTTLRQIRAHSQAPLVVLAPLQSLQANIAAELGADLQPIVFLAKPAGLHELAASLRAIAGGASSPLAAQALAGVAILVAEDNPFSSLLLKTLLERAGCRCQFATSGREAVELSLAQRFELLVIDLHMPEISGIEAIRLIKTAANPNAATPVIVLTADILRQEREAAFAAGANRILFKPLDEKLLLDTLLALTGRQRAAGGDEPGSSEPLVPKELYFNEIDSLLAAAQRAREAGDNAALRDHVHQLLGVAGVFRLGAIEKLVHNLHALVKAGDQGGIDAAIEAIRAQARALRAEHDG